MAGKGTEKEKNRILSYLDDHKKTKIATFVVGGFLALYLVLIILTSLFGGSKGSSGSDAATALPSGVVTVGNDGSLPDTNSSSSAGNGGTDQQLAQEQPDLDSQYGNPPSGFVWDQNGGLISLGDPKLSSSDAAIEYLRAISTLDFSVAQKLSRGTATVSDYSQYFSTTTTNVGNQLDTAYESAQFKDAMLSVQNKGTVNNTTFANNQVSYTFNITVVDLSNTTFWLKDKKKIYADISKAESGQNSSNQAEQYLNNYCLNYFSSPNAATKTVQVTLTVQKYPDLNTGWLVSNDDDLDAVLTNKSGTNAPTYILSQYQQDQNQNGSGK